MEQTVNIREAEKKDINPLIKLFMKIMDYHNKIDKGFYESSNGKKVEDKLKDDITSYLEDPDAKIVVAEIDKKIVGYMIGTFSHMPLYMTNKYMGMIAHAFILEKHRRQKIGQKMFNELKKWFKNNKVKCITLLVDVGNNIAIKAWEKYSFSTNRIDLVCYLK